MAYPDCDSDSGHGTQQKPLPSPSFFDGTNAGTVIRVQATNFAKAAKFAPVPELREPGRHRV